MATIRQDISVLATSDPVGAWFGDDQLATPILLGPRDKATICSPEAELEAFVTNGLVGVPLFWTAVTGATFYVVQWCANSSFSGPTMHSVRTTLVTQTLRFLSDIRIGEEVFWRVVAFNNSGGRSSKSETWSFIYECPDIEGNAENDSIGCVANNVHLAVIGPDTVKGECCQALYHVLINHDCVDDKGRTLTISSIAWSIRQSFDNPSIQRSPVIFACISDEFVVVRVNSERSEVFQMVCTVTLSNGVTTFQCNAAKDVTIDVHSKCPDDIRHAKVSCVYGCNIYGIDFVDRTFDVPILSSDETCAGAGAPDLCETNDSSGGGTSDNCQVYCFDWIESLATSGQSFAADIKHRVLPNGAIELPVGTDLIVAKISVSGGGEDCTSSYDNTSTDAACPLEVLANKAKWWIIEADVELPDPCDRPSLNVVSGVICADGTSSGNLVGKTIKSLCSTKIIFPPGTIICDTDCDANCGNLNTGAGGNPGTCITGCVPAIPTDGSPTFTVELPSAPIENPLNPGCTACGSYGSAFVGPILLSTVDQLCIWHTSFSVCGGTAVPDPRAWTFFSVGNGNWELYAEIDPSRLDLLSSYQAKYIGNFIACAIGVPHIFNLVGSTVNDCVNWPLTATIIRTA